MRWIPLHVHSQFSILDSTLSVKAIAKMAKDFGLPAVALTDSGNLHGAVDFYKACQAQKVQAIIGAEVYLAPASRKEKKKISGSPNFFPLILLAKNQKGYSNLCKLTSAGFLEGFYYRPRIDKELLSEHAEGLICLSGPIKGKIPYLIAQNDQESLNEEIDWFLKTFGEDFYLELQRHPMSDEEIRKDQMPKETWLVQHLQDYVKEQEKVNQALIKLGKERNIPCVATNDSHYARQEDWKGHEILLNIQSGEPCEVWERDARGNPTQKVPNPKRKVYPSHKFYFRSSQEMETLFVDAPEALENTLKIAQACNFAFDFQTKHYPVYYPPHLDGQQLAAEERQKAVAEYLYKLCNEAIEKRYPTLVLEEVGRKYPDKNPHDVIRDRMEYEFEIIASKGLCDYMLIVYDFISWAKRNAISVGPGRGSAAGSILAYLLGITDIEPLRFHLFFERFINPERLSYPDIDVDICMERRGEVIDYTIQKYGRDKVAQIITFGTMKAKMAVRDVGRVLSVPLAKVNQIVKLVPDDLNITLEKALSMDPELAALSQSDEEAGKVLAIAQMVEGSIRNTSTHAAGVIISASVLTDHIPVCNAKDSEMLVTQYSMKPAELVGMLKVDFLGLKTLTCIEKAVAFIKRNTQKIIDVSSLSLDDQKTFDLLNQGKTLGVFQLESGGMQELAKQLHIDKFEEIIAVGALYRPGPMDMIPTFIARKHGREPIEFDHPLMKDILEETYGVMVYQEQVMQIASRLAGYTLGEGDVLRRAMGKKDRVEMEKQRDKFVKGSLDNGIPEETSIRIFDKIEKFASYGFNKSHAAAYAYLSYITAYLKANYPHEWMAALMTCDRDDLSKVAKFIGEGASMGIPILPSDVNEAGGDFSPTKEGIRFAMSGIKGVGQGVVEAIVEERTRRGPYLSLFDFIKRIDTSRVGKKNIELLIDAGAFDFTKWPRDALRVSVEGMYDRAAKEQKEASHGVMNIFSLMKDPEENTFLHPPTEYPKSTKLQMLQREKELLGFYLTAHPLDDYTYLIPRLSSVPLSDIGKLPDESVFRVIFLIEAIKVKVAAKSLKKFAILIISDGTDSFELPIWSNMYEEFLPLLTENRLIYAVLQLEKKEDSVKLSCRWLGDLAKVDEKMIKACDDVFDQSKNQAYLMRLRSKTNASAMKKLQAEPKEEKMKKSLFLIQVDADTIKFSHLLNLKKLVESYPGDLPMEIQFFSSAHKKGTISRPPDAKTPYDENLKKEILTIPSVMKCEER